MVSKPEDPSQRQQGKPGPEGIIDNKYVSYWDERAIADRRGGSKESMQYFWEP